LEDHTKNGHQKNDFCKIGVLKCHLLFSVIIFVAWHIIVNTELFGNKIFDEQKCVFEKSLISIILRTYQE